jgi:hypothetical protein
LTVAFPPERPRPNDPLAYFVTLAAQDDERLSIEEIAKKILERIPPKRAVMKRQALAGGLNGRS